MLSRCLQAAVIICAAIFWMTVFQGPGLGQSEKKKEPKKESPKLKHTSSDPMKCKVCRPAYEKAMEYVCRKVRSSTFPVKMVAGWTFLADTRYPKDLKHCIDAAVGWSRQRGYNEGSHSGNWYPALASVLLAEYYKHHKEKSVYEAMKGIVDYFVRTQERTGGWWKWYEGAYKDRLDYPVVDHGFISSLVLSFMYSARVHGIRIPKDTFERGEAALMNITNARGIGYGTSRKSGRGGGDKTGARGGMAILGLGYAGRTDHKIYKIYKNLLPQKLSFMDQGHHVGSFHCLGSVLGCHLLGPKAYRQLTELWLDRLIQKQDEEGGLYIGDDGDAGGEEKLLRGNVAATASFALLIRLQDLNRLVPKNRGRNKMDGSLTAVVKKKPGKDPGIQAARTEEKKRREAAQKTGEAKSAAVATVRKDSPAWDGRLLVRVREAMAAGESVHFESIWFKGVAKVTGIDEKGRINVCDVNGRVSMKSALNRLPVEDRGKLALKVLRFDHPEDYCLCAYYAAAAGDMEACRGFLAKAGEKGVELEDFLRKCGALE